MSLALEPWSRLKEVFEGARGLASDTRAAYLAAGEAAPAIFNGTIQPKK